MRRVRWILGMPISLLLVVLSLVFVNRSPWLRLARWLVVLAVLSGLGYFIWLLFTHEPGGAHTGASFPILKENILTHKTAEGRAYTVDASQASVGLRMAQEDQHAQRIFSSYAAALRYAREQKLASIPSVSLVLAANRPADARLLATLEAHLSDDPVDGLRVLLRRWLEAVLTVRKNTPAAERSAHDAATLYLAQALALDGDTVALPDGLDAKLQMGLKSAPADPPQGPWTSSERMACVWRRDRHLQSALPANQEQLPVACLLARCLTNDPALAAGLARQAAVARAWVKPKPILFEDLAIRLDPATGRPREALADLNHRLNFSPGAAAWSNSPEEAILGGRAMVADPVSHLIAAMKDGLLATAPADDAGWYVWRWHALSTLADPNRAPEQAQGKCFPSPGYVLRWQRAFAAGIAEGRETQIKRLPIIYEGISGFQSNPVIEIAPSFIAEPAPIVYLRLARAYRRLEQNLAQALGSDRWEQLRDASGIIVATALRERIRRHEGLALRCYRELGFPVPQEKPGEMTEAEAAIVSAQGWCADLEKDADVISDARLLVPLMQGGNGQVQHIGIAGIRLEPVEYRWVDKPKVRGDIEAHFVPAQLWLASPCPITLCANSIMSADEFRRRCDQATDVHSLFAGFKQLPPSCGEPGRPWLRWSAWAGVFVGFVILGWLAKRRWSRLRWRGRLGSVAVIAMLLTWLWIWPPAFLLCSVVRHVVPLSPAISLFANNLVREWGGYQRTSVILIGLLVDENPQTRATAAWMLNSAGSINPITVRDPQIQTILERAIDDPIPEVAGAAWWLIMNAKDPVWLLERWSRFDANTKPDQLRTLGYFLSRFPEILPGAFCSIVEAGDPTLKHIALRALCHWVRYSQIIQHDKKLFIPDPTYPRAIVCLRQALDPSDVRCCLIALEWCSECSETADLPVILRILNGDSERLRWKTLEILQRMKSHELVAWNDEAVQKGTLMGVRDENRSFNERLNFLGRLITPQEVRYWSVRLLPLALQGPKESPNQKWQFKDRIEKITSFWTWAVTIMPESIKENAEDASWEIARDTPINFRDMLRQALGREDTREAAIDSITAIGPEVAELAPDLKALHDNSTDQELRWHCVNALAHLGPTVAAQVAPLLEALREDVQHGEQARKLLTR